MRILIVHSIYRPFQKGGAEVVVEKFVDELKKRHEVIVLTAKSRKSKVESQKSKGMQESIEDGVTVIRFSPFNIFSIHDIENKPLWQRILWHALDVWNVHSWFVMRKILKEYRPDVVWTHTLKGIGYLAFKAVKSQKSTVNSRLKWIFTPHNEEYVYQFGYGLPPFRIGLIENMTMLFTRWFTKGPDFIFSPSKYIQDFYRNLGFWKGIPGSWDWPVFVTSDIQCRVSGLGGNSGENRECHPEVVGGSPFTFGFLGQLEEHKGVRLLMKAFQTYQNRDVRLLIAGRGSLAEYVRKASSEDSRMTFFGEYRTDQLGELFRKMNVLVVPSVIRDNMPTVILEAFAHGIPVIGSNAGGIPEALSNGKGLFLHGLKESDFHRAFEEAQRPEVYSGLVRAVADWKPLSVGESLTMIGL